MVMRRSRLRLTQKFAVLHAKVVVALEFVKLYRIAFHAGVPVLETFFAPLGCRHGQGRQIGVDCEVMLWRTGM